MAQSQAADAGAEPVAVELVSFPRIAHLRQHHPAGRERRLAAPRPGLPPPALHGTLARVRAAAVEVPA
jgi:hypothetical protein